MGKNYRSKSKKENKRKQNNHKNEGNFSESKLEVLVENNNQTDPSIVQARAMKGKLSENLINAQSGCGCGNASPNKGRRETKEAKNQRTAETHKAEGNDLFKNGKYDEARAKYTLAINLCPNSAIYYGNRAACYLNLNDFPSCLKDAQRSIDLDENFVKGHYRVIKCYLALGEIDKAEAAINRVVDLKMKNSEIEQEQKQFKKLLDLNTKIYDSYDLKKFSPCLNFINEALKIASACRRYQVLKAEILIYLGRKNDAVSVMKKVKTDPNLIDVKFVTALIAYYNGSVTEAFKGFEEILKQDPNHSKTKAFVAKATALKNKKDEGNNLFIKEKYSEAIKIYTEALTVDPYHKMTNSILFFNRALAHIKLNNQTEALNDCTEALKLDPKYFKAIVKRANLYFEFEKYKECIEDCKSALRIKQNDQIKELLEKARAKIRESMKDYYQILGVNRNDTLDKIKKAYRSLALIHHPDRHVTESAEVKKQQEVKFKEIGQAYAVLSDPAKRKRYNYRYDNPSYGDDDDNDITADELDKFVFMMFKSFMARKFFGQFGGGCHFGCSCEDECTDYEDDEDC